MKGRAATTFLIGAAFLALVTFLPTDARAQLQVDSKDGKGSIKLGLLLQGQYEAIKTEYGTAPDQTTNWAQNLFLRRLRLIFGGKYDKVSFFVETDSPNLGKASTTTGVKDNTSAQYIQDAWITYTQNDAFMVDAGMFLVPIVYQSLQSAGTLLAVDYGPYSFLDSTVTQERVGRDYGFQFRGYPVKKHLEYRVGLTQGVRQLWTGTVKNNAPFRYFARLQYHVFEPQTGFLYTGTTLGEKKMLDIGATYSGQADYKVWGGNIFFDWPINGNGLTAQVDYADYDGGAVLPYYAPPAGQPQPLTTGFGKQKVAFFEAGFYIKSVKLMPFVQWSEVKHDSVLSTDVTSTHLTKEDKLIGGLAWMPYGHKFNLKLAYGKLGYSHNAAASIPDQDQVVLQAQFFYF